MDYDEIGDELDEALADFDVEGDDEDGDDWDDDIEGDFEEVGKARRRRRARRGRLVRPKRTLKKKAPIGFGTQNVAGGGTATFTVTPKRSIKPVRLLVTCSATPELVLVTSIQIGDSEQVVAGSIPSLLYGPNAQQDKPDDFEVCPGGIPVTVTVVNGAVGALDIAVGMKAIVTR